MGLEQAPGATMDKQELHERIRNAFEDVPHPGDENLAAPDAREDEVETLLEWYAGKDRYSFQPHELWKDAFYWMTPEAAHYYLPAYLIAATDNGIMRDEAIYILTPDTAPKDEEGNLFLSSSQKQGIYEFLDWLLDDYLTKFGTRDDSYRIYVVDSMVDEIVKVLKPRKSSEEPQEGSFFLLPFGRLTDAQKAVIYEFLDWILKARLSREIGQELIYNLDNLLKIRNTRDYWRQVAGLPFRP